MPLKALCNGQPLYSWNLNESHRRLGFSCPHCDDELILVLPVCDIIKHFRHKNNEAHGEPETPEHLDGKQHLINCLNEIGIKSEPEVKIGETICDVFIPHKNNPIALEYQCSTITHDELTRRGNSRATAGVEINIWILGGYYFDHATTFRYHEKKGKAYEIQRILSIEERMRYQPLLYLHNKQFYKSSWSYRYKAEKLGWYNLQKVHEGHFLNLIRTFVDDE